MGKFTDSAIAGVKSASGVSYKVSFRYYSEPGKDMPVTELGIPVEIISPNLGPSATQINVKEADDNSIRMVLGIIRKQKFVYFLLSSPPDEARHVQKDLNYIYALDEPFHIGLGVQKLLRGNKVESYVLRDNGAKFLMPAALSFWKAPGDTSPPSGSIMFSLALKAPELLHGVGDNYNLKKA
jgi:hypothetical protein